MRGNYLVVDFLVFSHHVFSPFPEINLTLFWFSEEEKVVSFSLQPLIDVLIFHLPAVFGMPLLSLHLHFLILNQFPIYIGIQLILVLLKLVIR